VREKREIVVPAELRMLGGTGVHTLPARGLVHTLPARGLGFTVSAPKRAPGAHPRSE
jgi:hypothetical protein